MKNLICLTVVALLHSFPVKACGKSLNPSYGLPFTHKQAMNLKLGGNTHYTAEVTSFLRFNTLTLKPTANGILLNWMVEETANLQYFLIEQAVDGQNFSPLYEVPVQPNQQAYSFIDDGFKTLDKPVYYRVKAIYPTIVLASPVRRLEAQMAKR